MVQKTHAHAHANKRTGLCSRVIICTPCCTLKTPKLVLVCIIHSPPPTQRTEMPCSTKIGPFSANKGIGDTNKSVLGYNCYQWILPY